MEQQKMKLQDAFLKANEQSIVSYLEFIEKYEWIKILYAAESGSRAWGFSSPDSDYDVRFIYAHQTPHYLSFNVENRRDVIECPVPENDWDVKGWDIRKALKLFAKSNGSLMEWLNSPTVYRPPVEPIQDLRYLADNHFDPVALYHHYHNLGAKTNNTYLNKPDRVSLKKYLYTIRAFVASMWVYQKESLPAVSFPQLLKNAAAVNANVELIYDDAMRLVQDKVGRNELGEGERILTLDRFIDMRIKTYAARQHHPLESRKDLKDKKQNELERIFRRCVMWGESPELLDKSIYYGQDTRD